MEVNGNHIFTLRDAMTLAQGADKSAIGKTMYDSAILGNYVMSPQNAVNEAARRKSGAHMLDAGTGLAATGMPEGKTTDHMTFSNESPYNISGLRAAQGGSWDQLAGGNYTYTPSQQTVAKHGANSLARYFDKYEKGNNLNIKY